MPNRRYWRQCRRMGYTAYKLWLRGSLTQGRDDVAEGVCNQKTHLLEEDNCTPAVQCRFVSTCSQTHTHTVFPFYFHLFCLDKGPSCLKSWNGNTPNYRHPWRKVPGSRIPGQSLEVATVPQPCSPHWAAGGHCLPEVDYQNKGTFCCSAVKNNEELGLFQILWTWLNISEVRCSAKCKKPVKQFASNKL